MSLISDAIQGFVILAILCGIYGFTSDMIFEAGRAQNFGIMSYQAFTQKLLNPSSK